MAFTGEKVKGSRVLTPETLENRRALYNVMNELKENNETEYEKSFNQMFWSMFEHLSHAAQKEFVEWARNEEWITFFKKNEA